MNMYSTAAEVRNDKPHHLPFPPIELTPAGRLIWLRTRRASSTCNLLAQLAGIGTER